MGFARTQPRPRPEPPPQPMDDGLVAALERVAEAIEAGTIQPIVCPEGASIVLRVPYVLGEKQRATTQQIMEHLFLGRTCVVLDDGAEISVMAETETDTLTTTEGPLPPPDPPPNRETRLGDTVPKPTPPPNRDTREGDAPSER